MKILSAYFKSLSNNGIQVILIEFIAATNSWRYKLSCIQPINSAQKIDVVFKALHHLVEDLILDGYDVKIIDDLNLLIQKV